jgi:hypothetical protein
MPDQPEILDVTAEPVAPLYAHNGHTCYEVANNGYITHLPDGQVGSFPVVSEESQADFEAALAAYYTQFPPA